MIDSQESQIESAQILDRVLYGGTKLTFWQRRYERKKENNRAPVNRGGMKNLSC